MPVPVSPVPPLPPVSPPLPVIPLTPPLFVAALVVAECAAEPSEGEQLPDEGKRASACRLADCRVRSPTVRPVAACFAAF